MKQQQEHELSIDQPSVLFSELLDQAILNEVNHIKNAMDRYTKTMKELESLLSKINTKQ